MVLFHISIIAVDEKFYLQKTFRFYEVVFKQCLAFRARFICALGLNGLNQTNLCFHSQVCLHINKSQYTEIHI